MIEINSKIQKYFSLAEIHERMYVKFLFCSVYFKLKFLYANIVDPDQKQRSATSDLVLHCLPRSQKWEARYIWVKKTPCDVSLTNDLITSL